MADNTNKLTNGNFSLRPLAIPTPDKYNQPYHPSVMFFAGGFGGYTYWMAQTGYPVGGSPYRDRWEYPCIYASNYGIDWVVPAGLTNPINDITTTEVANGDYLSDPHLVFKNGKLKCWYRITNIDHNEADLSKSLPTYVIRKTTTNGVTWSAREVMIDL